MPIGNGEPEPERDWDLQEAAATERGRVETAEASDAGIDVIGFEMRARRAIAEQELAAGAAGELCGIVEIALAPSGLAAAAPPSAVASVPKP
jgi:hypothetical protein